MSNLAAMLRLPANLKSTQWQILAGPILILLILSMMVLPLPAFILDLLFTFNIALSIMVLLVAMFTQRTLEFAAFPTILLFTTLLRLALNVASTRIILMEGHTGAAAAGKVVEAFGHFLVGGNFAIGIVVFVILVIINFMVITKGAGRIAEVGARFVLDGMPGKQMAIDADLNAGLIGEDEAKKRRSEVTQEADFYGSMDGASKFVRGDAIAGILIMVINVVGGLLVGVLQHGMSMGHAAESYTLLTIGDGLVAQIPALVISTAAGVIVTRVSTDQDVGEQMVNQLFSNPSVMLLSAAVLGLLGLVPGMPNLVFLLFTAGLLGLAWWIRGREQKAPAEAKPVKMAENNTVVEATWNDVQLEDSLGMEVGYRLIPMVDFQQDGELLGRIRSIRKKFAQEMGFLPPVVHIRDNMDLQPARYRILMKGVEIGSGDAYPGRWLAINPGTAAGTLPGEATVDPAFGLNAIWIESALKEQAQIQGYTVVEASTVVATHLNHLISQHAAELFGRQEAQQLLDRVAQEMPKLTEDLVPGVVTLTTLHKVLQNLLDEKVTIRDMRTILETLAEHAPIQSDPHELTAVVRVALGRAITQKWFPGKDEVHVIGLDTPLERLLLQALQGGGGLEPGLADRLLAQTQEALSRQEMLGAVVGVQPFGGEGLSGTGPKAGGPLYLYRLLANRPESALAVTLARQDAEYPVDAQLKAALTQPLNALREWAANRPELQALCTQYGELAQAGTQRLLPGPTGERNTWTLLPRERVLCIADDEQDALTQLAAVLAVGSQVLWPDDALHRQLVKALPSAVSERIQLAKAENITAQPFDAVIFHGDSDQLRALCEAVAARDGAIVSVQGFARGESNILLERLYIERSLSVNTAAAGGNASLMTIG